MTYIYVPEWMNLLLVYSGMSPDSNPLLTAVREKKEIPQIMSQILKQAKKLFCQIVLSLLA